jgi:hypothetical protein
MGKLGYVMKKPPYRKKMLRNRMFTIWARATTGKMDTVIIPKYLWVEEGKGEQ